MEPLSQTPTVDEVLAALKADLELLASIPGEERNQQNWVRRLANLADDIRADRKKAEQWAKKG